MHNLIPHFLTCYAYSVMIQPVYRELKLVRALNEDTSNEDSLSFFAPLGQTTVLGIPLFISDPGNFLFFDHFFGGWMTQDSP